jgi:hypothetical protein
LGVFFRGLFHKNGKKYFPKTVTFLPKLTKIINLVIQKTRFWLEEGGKRVQNSEFEVESGAPIPRTSGEAALRSDHFKASGLHALFPKW